MKRSEQKLKNMDLTVGETIGSGAKKNSEHMASDSLLAILGQENKQRGYSHPNGLSRNALKDDGQSFSTFQRVSVPKYVE